MVIEESDFRLIPISESSPLYDLELLYKISPRGKESRMEFKNVAYGITLESAIKRIAHYKVHCNHSDEVIKLQAYLKEFTEALESLKNLCN